MLKFVWVNSSIVALWRYMTTQTFVNTDLYNGLSPALCQAVTETNADLLSIRP